MTYTKKEMRQAYIARLQQLDSNIKLKEERALAQKLYDQPAWLNAQVIALTLSQSFELDTAPLILRARHKGQTVVVPRTLPHRQMEFVELTEETHFGESSFGVLEPLDGRVFDKADIDLMVVPGVAFTPAGKRLGFGGGYYDRYLADYTGATVAVVLTTQVAQADEWPGETHDITVQQVVSLVD